MKLLIAGSRAFENRAAYVDLMTFIHNLGFRTEIAFDGAPEGLSPGHRLDQLVTEVLCGGAVGADTLGEEWAANHEVPIRYFPADWGRHGRAAGPIRNREMAREADQAVIMWDGKSPGTKNMIEELKKLGKKAHILRREAPTKERVA